MAILAVDKTVGPGVLENATVALVLPDSNENFSITIVTI